MDNTLLLRNALTSIRRNERAILTKLFPAYLVCFALWTAMFALVLQAETGQGPRVLLIVVLAVVSFLLAVGVAVAWHRSILAPDAIWPPQHTIWRYIGISLFMGILMAVVMFLPGLVFGIITSMGVSGAEGLFNWVILCASQFISLRWGLVLPQAALGRSEIGVFESWRLTEDRFQEIAVCVFVLLGVTVCIELLKIWLVSLGDNAAINTTFIVFLSPIPVLLNLSMMTELYRDHMERTAQPASDV